MILTLIAVALATSSAPSAKIVITVPASFIKNGSKIFFNKDFHGRLLLSAGLDVQHFQQFGKTKNLESSWFSGLDRFMSQLLYPRMYSKQNKIELT